MRPLGASDFFLMDACNYVAYQRQIVEQNKQQHSWKNIPCRLASSGQSFVDGDNLINYTQQCVFVKKKKKNGDGDKLIDWRNSYVTRIFGISIGTT
jgi:hypothetical protein